MHPTLTREEKAAARSGQELRKECPCGATHAVGMCHQCFGDGNNHATASPTQRERCVYCHGRGWTIRFITTADSDQHSAHVMALQQAPERFEERKAELLIILQRQRLQEA